MQGSTLMPDNDKKTYSNLVEFGKKLLSNKDADQGLNIITEHLKHVTGAMRCSIFISDRDGNKLWTVLSDSIERISIPSNQGIVGQVWLTGKTIIENDVLDNPHFLKDIDNDSGYSTVNMIACPIYGSEKNMIGVLQVLNKLNGFEKEDLKFLNIFCIFISSYIELVPLYAENSDSRECQ
jgi:GAF domain-containing protein